MKKIIHLFLLLSSFTVFGQNNVSEERLSKINAFKQLNIDHLKIPEHIFFDKNRDAFGLSQCDFKLLRTHQIKEDLTYSRYQQYYESYKVIGGQYILHSENGIVVRGRGLLVPDLNINIYPAVTPIDAEDLAQEHLQSILLNQSIIKGDFIPKWETSKTALVIIDKEYPVNSGKYVLAYEVNLLSHSPKEINETMYIDANSGKLINYFTNIHEEAIETIAKTFYYGDQIITVDSIGPSQYEMVDNTRFGNKTLDGNFPEQVYSSEDNNWDSDSGSESVHFMASTGHYCTAEFSDYMRDYLNWDGIDGLGSPYLIKVDFGGKYYANAQWDGTYARFGNGNCENWNSFASLAIVGHEYAHGLIDYTSNLVYQDQSGALNESTADIFGKALEYKSDPENFSWYLGAKIARDPSNTGFRSMQDPTEKNDPKNYGGDFWYIGKGDRGGVHSNSGVMNHWFYLLVEGGSGLNENGVNYSVDPMPIDDVMTFFFNTHLGNFTENSNYFDAMNGTIDQATILFGAGSSEVENVIEAWKAVGLFPGINNKDLAINAVVESVGLCPGEEIDIDVILQNVGVETLLSGTQILFNYNTNNSTDYTESIFLNNDLEPGESLTHTLMNPLTETSTTSYQVNVSITVVGDLNQVNDNTIMQVRASEINGSDLNLVSFSFIQDRDCGEPLLTRYSYVIENLGCKSYLVGDSLIFTIDDGTNIHTIGRTMYNALDPGVYQGASPSISPPLVGNFKDYTVTVEVYEDDDQNMTNNVREDAVSFIEIIDNSYFENFDPTVNKDVFFTSSNQYYGIDSIYNLDGNYVLAFTGQRRSGSFVDCEVLEEFFESYYYYSYLRYCVDATGMEEPVFQFDMAQYYNEEFQDDIKNLSNRSLVQIITNDFTTEIIFGQEEGVFVPHEIELPLDYQGVIEVKMINLTGYPDPFEEDNLASTDAVFIDNVRFFDRIQELEKFGDNDYIIYPNPVSDQLRYERKLNDTSFDIMIHDQLGRLLVDRRNVKDDGLFDLSQWSSGVYIVTILEENNNVFQEKIIVHH